MKKVIKPEETINPISTTLPDNIQLVYNQPLNLHLDFGRQDLNENFLKIQEAINELKKC